MHEASRAPSVVSEAQGPRSCSLTRHCLQDKNKNKQTKILFQCTGRVVFAALPLFSCCSSCALACVIPYHDHPSLGGCGARAQPQLWNAKSVLRGRKRGKGEVKSCRGGSLEKEREVCACMRGGRIMLSVFFFSADGLFIYLFICLFSLNCKVWEVP